MASERCAPVGHVYCIAIDGHFANDSFHLGKCDMRYSHSLPRTQTKGPQDAVERKDAINMI